MAKEMTGTDSGGSVPVPDPTVLTTNLVDRALSSFREIMETRLDGMDKAVLLVAEQVAAITPTATGAQQMLHGELDRRLQSQFDLVKEMIQRLEEVSDEKFSAIDGQFVSNALALAAALAAAKDAVAEQNKSNTLAIAKSEVATQKQIDAQGTLVQTGFSSMDDKFADVKSRLDRMEGHSSGISAAWGVLLGAVGLLASVVALFAVFKA